MFTGLLPPSASTFGAQIDSVIRLIFYCTAFWTILIEGLIIYFAIRFRRTGSRRAVYQRGETPRELAWIFVPAALVLILDLGIDAAGHAAWVSQKIDFPKPTLEIAASAKQFNWDFTYAGPDGKLGTSDDIAVSNELHVPVGAKVRLTLSSKDVIHSFWIPSFRLKQDVVPGRVIPIWFEATRPGTYEIPCAELCGFGHYTMRGLVIVQSEQEYEQWMRKNLQADTSSGGSSN